MKKTSIPVLGSSDAKATVSLPKSYSDVVVNPALVAQYVHVYLQNARAGTASTKDRSQIIGTTKKMYKQKGTGNARHASAKAPIFVGGGVVGGPKPRGYSVRINNKQRTQAFESVIASRVESNKMFVLAPDTFTEKPNTKSLVAFFKKNGITKSCTLVVSAPVDKNLILSARNNAMVTVVPVQNVNPYTALKGAQIVFSNEAFSTIFSNVK